MTGSMNVGARVMISREGLERTGLIKTGSRAAQRHLFKLPTDRSLEIRTVRDEIQKAFPTRSFRTFAKRTHSSRRISSAANDSCRS
jgi:putative ABC transport system permease protein